jgi:circadian clock protein KaiB
MTGSTADDRWVLTLYVTGASAGSIHAIETVRRVCDEELGGHVELDVIDVRQQPALAARDQIVAAPTLIRRSPGPPRRIVGDLSGSSLMRLGLDIGAAGISGEDRASAG